MKLFFGCLSNNEFILKMVLLQSALDGHTIYQASSETATQGWNELLEKAEQGSDVAVLCHNDMFFPEGWLDKLFTELDKLPQDWVIAGFYGLDEDFKECGKIHDRRIPVPMATKHDFPVKATAIDGCAFLVNLKKGFRFEELPGHDLYDVYMILRAKEMGGSSWIIDCMPEHYPRRPWDWKPDSNFQRVWEWLKVRFPSERIVSTCCR